MISAHCWGTRALRHVPSAAEGLFKEINFIKEGREGEKKIMLLLIVATVKHNTHGKREMKVCGGLRQNDWLIFHVGLQVGALLGRGGFSGSHGVHLYGSFHRTIHIAFCTKN